MALGSRCQREERAQGHMSASGTSPETPPPPPPASCLVSKMEKLQ